VLGHGKEMIHLDAKTISEKMVQKIPDNLRDLLEIATYVYCGDQCVSRGGTAEFEYGEKWNRRLHFEIPVRNYDFWASLDIVHKLKEILSFASGDTYSFHFHKMKGGQEPDFLDLGKDEGASFPADEVLLFSGGLDSFTGALDKLVDEQKHIALVSHQSNFKLRKLQGDLCNFLNNLVSSDQPPMLFHVPVLINKDKHLTHETSQRSRSFLYAALGSIIAHMFRLQNVKFYENGVISCHLPFDGQTPQARRTRSTHPRLLAEMSELVSQLVDRDFTFENPYFCKTKTEVLERLNELKHALCIENTRSCAAANYQNPATHCGLCSQCIDRRFAVLASLCEKYEKKYLYKVDLFEGERETVEDRAMAAGIAGFAIKVTGTSLNDFTLKNLSELIQISSHMGIDREEAFRILYDLHHRHGIKVTEVITKEMEVHAEKMVKGLLPKHCLLSMIGRKEHLNIEQITTNEKGKTKRRPKKRKGRPVDPKTSARDKQMCEAWETGQYKTYTELGNAFDLNEAAARMAVRRYKQRQAKLQK